MPIRTMTLEQAASRFITAYRDHLRLNSPARFIDPRECNQCNSAFEDLVFALDGTMAPRTTFERINGGLAIVPEDKIIELFGEARAE